MQGAGANHTQYLQTLHYDKFEQRTYMKLGNGIETRSPTVPTIAA